MKACAEWRYIIYINWSSHWSQSLYLPEMVESLSYWDRHHNNILNVILLIHVDVLSPVISALFNIVMIGA